jgi:hypothetical protein
MMGVASISALPISTPATVARILVVTLGLSGTASLSPHERVDLKTSATVSGAAVLSLSARRLRMSVASLQGFGTLSAATKFTGRPSANLTGVALLSPHERVDFKTHASLFGEAMVDANFNFTIYVATKEFITEPTDTPPNRPFYGTLQKALRLDRSIVDSSGFGRVTSGWGELELINLEGDYDFLIKNYAVDGRAVNIKIGAEGASYNSFITLFAGTATGWHVAEDILRVGIRDNGYLLEVPIQTNTYAGTGDFEGGTDLAGKRRPLGFGEILNVSPPLVVPAYLIYQLHDGETEAIDAVYDRGVALAPAGPADYATSAALLAATDGAAGSGANIEAGEYATCLAEGYFRLGGMPVGTVTADFHGDADGGYVDTTAGVVQRILERVVGTALRTAAFDTLDARQPAPIGYYVDPSSEMQVTDVVAQLMGAIGGWGGFRRDGRFEVGIFDAPSGASSAQYERTDIIEIDRQPLPAGLDPPPWRYRVVWGRNWTVQTDVEGGSGITADRVAFLAQSTRLASSDADQGTLIKTNHPRAQDPAPVESYFVDEADAQAEADRLLDLYGVTNSLYRIVLTSHPFVHEVGEVIYVTFPRWDLARGRRLRIVGLTEDTDEARTEIVGFG